MGDAIGSHGSVFFYERGEEAHGYVVSSFCKSYEPSGLLMLGMNARAPLPQPFRKMVHGKLYSRIKATLARSRVLAAVHSDQPDSIVGCIVYECRKDGPVIHYVYVDHPVRRFGLASAMLTALARTCPDANKGARYTHHTPAGAKLARRFNLSFTPEEA